MLIWYIYMKHKQQPRYHSIISTLSVAYFTEISLFVFQNLCLSPFNSKTVFVKLLYSFSNKYLIFSSSFQVWGLQLVLFPPSPFDFCDDGRLRMCVSFWSGKEKMQLSDKSSHHDPSRARLETSLWTIWFSWTWEYVSVGWPLGACSSRFSRILHCGYVHLTKSFTRKIYKKWKMW